MVGLVLRTGLGLDANPGGGAPGGGPPSYEGPLDLVPGAVVGYSLARALVASMLGQEAYTVQALDGDEEPTQAFSYDAQTGAIGAAAITAFLDGDDGAVVALEDHSGNDVGLTASGQDALWGASLQDGKPGMTMAAGESLFAMLESSLPNGGATFFAVVSEKIQTRFSGNNGGNADFQSGSGILADDCLIFLRDSGGVNKAGTLAVTPPDGVHLWEAAWEFGSRSFMVDGVELTLTDSLDAVGAVAAISEPFAINAAGNDAVFIEVIWYPSVLSGADRLTLRQNIAAYYGITL